MLDNFPFFLRIYTEYEVSIKIDEKRLYVILELGQICA